MAFWEENYAGARGWLLDYDGERRQEILGVLTREARKFCGKRGAMALEISPNVVSQSRDGENKVVEGANHLEVKQELEKMGYKYLGEEGQAKWLYVLDLEGKTPEGLLMEFRTTHRQLINKAEREEVRVRELGDDELGIFEADYSGIRGAAWVPRAGNGILSINEEGFF